MSFRYTVRGYAAHDEEEGFLDAFVDAADAVAYVRDHAEATCVIDNETGLVIWPPNAATP